MIPTTNAVVVGPFSVVVIGGGFAGLSAVQTLVRESQQQQDQSMPSSSSSLRPMHITLLEAKDRLGGRMHTVSLNPSTATTASKTSDDDELHSSSAPVPVPVVADMGGMYFHGQGSVLKNLQEAFPQWKTTGSGGDSAVPAGHDAIFKVYQRNNNNNNIDNQNNENTNNELRTARDLTAREKQEISDLYTEWMNDMQKRFHEFQNNSNNNDNDSVVDESSHPALLSKWSQEFCNRVLQRQGDDDDDDDPDNSAKKQDEESNKHEEEEEEEEERLLLLLQGLEFYQRMHFDLDFAIAWPQVAMDGWTNDWGCNDLPGDDVISVDGMRALIHAMEMQLNEMTDDNDNYNIPTTLTIRKQTRVERIEYDLDCSQSLLSKSCRIVTSDQAVFEADACICTIPLGVLKKRAMELFVPPLPSDKLQALERAGVGTLNTLVVQWNKPIHGYCCEKTIEEESKKDKSNHDATTSSALPSGYYLIGPADGNKDDNNNNDNAVDKNTNPLWHGFVFPEVLRNQQDASITQFHFYETENLPFDNLDFWKLQALQVVQAALVGSSRSICLDDIVNVQLSAWHLDPDCLGSYSAPTTRTRGNVDRKILAEPIVVRASYDGAGTRTGLYFAGEHTHYEGRFATMDGAYETGIRAARQVLQQKADGAGR